ncbi:eukaryotic translation initiation factor 4G [Corylus avellana]|uniref:eukaryotic translation initiation factor 4G n=1 Tax=Corylus avellana TaxID=13451 RepID=UPI00286D0740|nr:eukaryotic translation initiation factor 4G [Corylus avellana]XP_059434972.1 eukaryotic translation initiation factor 4G [Corylus avellana]
MSYNQSRSDKNDSTQYRKSDRRSTSSNQQRGSSGGYVKGGGPAPSPSYGLSSSRGFKRNNNNAQGGGQSRASVPTVNNSSSLESSNVSTPRSAAVQNGSHVQPQFHGASDMPITSPAAKPAELPAPQRSNRTVPKVPTPQPSSMNSDSAAPRTPIKATGDASKAFSFQFGSISPGFMNGMQVPARTSSAPPNLDEQKRDQARHDSFRSAPPLPTPSAPKQPLLRKDAGAVNQPNTGEAYPVPKAKKDAQVSPAPPVSQQQKPPGLPMTGMSMSMPFHQSQVSVQYGGPNQQLQSQGMTAAPSLQMPMHMPLAMGNPSQVQPSVFVPGLQPHPMQTQGIIHQGQGMSFTTQMGPPQLPPQLSSMGITMSPQYPPQQGGKFGGQRKTTVKITHPDTHEELRLDKRADSYSDGGSSAPRSHPNVAPQSQPIPSYAPPHSLSFYPSNSYNASPIYYPPQSSVPLTSSQMAPSSQAPRFNYQVGQGPQNMTFMNPALSSLPVNKTGTQMHGVADLTNLEHSRDVHTIISSAPSTTIPVTVKPSAGSIGEKVADSMRPSSSHGVEKGESPKHVRPSGEASSTHPQRDSEICSESSLQQSKHGTESLVSKLLPVVTKQSAVSAVVSSEGLVSNPLSSASVSPSEESTVVVPNNEGRRREILGRSNSMKDHQKKTGKKGHIQLQHQVGSQSTSSSHLHSRALEHSISSNSGVPGAVEAKPALATPTTSEGVSLSGQSLLTVGGATDASELKVESVGEGSTSVSSEIPGPGIIVDTFETAHHAKLDESSLQNEELLHETVGKDEQGESRLPEVGLKQDVKSSEISLDPISLKSLEHIKHTEGKQSGQDSDLKAITISDEVLTLETAQIEITELVDCHAEMDGTTDFTDVGSSIGEKTSTSDVPSRSDSIDSKDVVTMSGISDQQSAPISTPDLLEATLKHEGEGAENFGGDLVSFAASVSKDKPSLDLSKAKSSTKGGKKKRKEILQKADAAGTTSDLYNAYKGPEEKKETVVSTDSTESTSNSADVKQASADAVEVDAIESEKGGMSKAEPDDWEDAADVSTPKLEVSDNGQQVIGRLDNHDKDEEVITAKKYSRDFLLKFAEQYNDLPKGFEITSDIEALMSANFNISHHVERDSYPSPGRIVDRPSGGSRIDRRGSGVVEEDRWSKVSGNFSSGRDPRPDLVYGGNAVGFRPGPGGNYGVLRNPRVQTPMQYPILLGPSMGSQGGMPRNNPDSERWLRATNIQKGLIPSPHTPLLVMHKAEKKYEVGKVTDEEQSKQRQLKAILNKLTPQNFEKLFEQVKAVNIDNAATLNGVISQIFDKALMEPTFCEMYADFCCHLAGELPDFNEDNEKVTFKRVLLNKCQEEFERGEREQEEANKVDEEGEIKQSAEEREEKRVKARRRMLGNIRLIGELYKKKMLTERIMHACIQKLLGQLQDPDEEDLEALCKLMSTIGEMIDHQKAKEHMDAYFDRMKTLSNNMNLSSRVRFMLKDAIDLRKNKWQQRRKVEGPKKIEEVHRDAAQERAQVSRMGRTSSINQSARRVPMEFAPRGSTMLSSPNAQTGGYRGLPTRGYGAQDVRTEERPSGPLPQRPIGDDSITLGPQGGLGRGMSIRGSPAMSSAPVADIPSVAADSRRTAAGLNGYGTVSERTTYGTREDLNPRYIPDRFAAPAAYDQISPQERNVTLGNRDLKNADRSFDRSLATSSPARGQGTSCPQNVPLEKAWPEERLREMSMAAIKEFYSARDEKEVELCIKELNSPSFHALMVSLWVTDSFERKDMERDVLAKLLVNLTKSRDGVLSQAHLIKGFESVLTNLEDAVNDAPRAPEFLGRIFAKVVTENVIPLREIGMLIHDGGEEPGRLRDLGLAGDVLGSILEMIKSEKGDSVLSEIRTSSNLRLEDFRPLDPNRSRKLENFI